MKPTDLPPKIAAKIRIDTETACWLWTGYAKDGYGRLHWPPNQNGKEWRAHRLVWTLLKDPIPEGMVLDHLCRVRHCVNPAHMEVVTHAENASRVGGTPNRDGLCRKGKHPWIPANIYTKPNGNQECRCCHDERAQHVTASGRWRKARPGSGQQSFL